MEVYDPALFNATHFFKLATDKCENRDYEECLKFCDMAIKIGKESAINLDLMIDVITLKRQMITRLTPSDPHSRILQLPELLALSHLALAVDFYHLKGKATEQYARCFEQLRKPIFQVGLTLGSRLHQQKLILQGKALRRWCEVEETFDEKPWQKYTNETKEDFLDFIAFRITFSPLIDERDRLAYVKFMMMDVNGVGLVNVWDAQQMIRDFKLLKYCERLGLWTSEPLDLFLQDL